MLRHLPKPSENLFEQLIENEQATSRDMFF
jgi:hypothetical protein